MAKVVLMNDEDVRIEREYQTARAQAHRLADSKKVNYVVVETPKGSEEVYAVAAETEAPKGQKVWYIARPDTVSYMQYKADAEKAGVAVLPKEEWILGGRKSYAGMIIEEYGDERGGEMLSRSKAAPRKRDATVIVSGKEVPAGEAPTKGKTKMVWDIANSLVVDGVSATRAAIVEACVAAGVNKATAGTQYAAWVRANKEAK